MKLKEGNITILCDREKISIRFRDGGKNQNYAGFGQLIADTFWIC